MLPVPGEPIDMRRAALEKVSQWEFLDRKATINMFVLGAGFLPKYLWENWRHAMKKQGIPWQVFLKAISACEYDANAWVEGNKSWEELVTVITKVIQKAKKGIYPLWPP